MVERNKSLKAMRTLQAKLILSGCFFLSILSGLHPVLGQGADNPTADRVLSAVYEKLAGMRSLQYAYRLELNYASEDYHRALPGSAYLEFTPSDTLIGFRYQVEHDNMKFVYNGTESFVLDQDQKTMRLNTSPEFQYFAGITAFYNSLVTLRKAIPALIADKTIGKSIADTTMDKRECYVIRLTLDRRVIDRLGGFSELGTDRKVSYEITVEKESYLPVQILQRNDQNQDFMLTAFSRIMPDAASPSELSWYYSSYADQYKLTQKKALQPLQEHTAAPDWQLPLYGSPEAVQLQQLRGKVVLLEFWTKNCGYCISVVPALNSLVKRFAHEQVVVLGVNAHDTEEGINSFYKKNRPHYKSVFKGKGVSEAYGVGYFPAIVLLDKAGRVLYQGEYDQKKIEGLIRTALQ